MSKRLARLLVCTAALLVGCVATDAPPGVPRGTTFSVTPIYPHSFDIVATGPVSRSGEVLRDAWQKKAAQVAAGRRFDVSRVTERVSEVVASGWPVRARSVSGTITVAGEQPQPRD